MTGSNVLTEIPQRGDGWGRSRIGEDGERDQVVAQMLSCFNATQ